MTISSTAGIASTGDFLTAYAASKFGVEGSMEDYAERTRTRATVAGWQSMNGEQGGDPAKLADALVQLVALDEPPVRFAAGADAVELFESKAQTLLHQAGAYRELSSSLGYHEG